MADDEYARWRNSPDCGHMTGTVYTGPRVCGRPAKFTVSRNCRPVVNGLVCGTHRRSVERMDWTTEPVAEEP
jgi:hypothetical protein